MEAAASPALRGAQNRDSQTAREAGMVPRFAGPNVSERRGALPLPLIQVQ